MERLERKKTTYTRKKRGGGGYRYVQTTRDHHHDTWTVDIHPLSPPQAYKYGSWACGMYPDLSYSEATAATETLVLGVAPQKTYFEGSESEMGAENGCKCGSDCKCNPCNCK
ncbi:Uncharacterized protein Fot_33074 [Forsythia ovata]|uniref:Metallothionein-like protein n=1 Tax=Forsythia ovata TaxID=205694 RepID=A0ABD1T9L7_9LAMI